MKVTFKGISKQYKGKYALKNFTSELENGIYGLLGANGAGKTTLINIFVGILKSDEGQILINGEDVRGLGIDFLSHIGYLPQYPQFYKNFEVMDFLRYMCVLKDIPMEKGEKRARELLEIVNLSSAHNKKIGALSGGMRQRVGIAQAMLGDPDILILDEPTAGLDPQERIRFRNLIAKFAENRIVLLATHIVSDIEFIANQVILLKDGQLVKQDTPQALMREMEGKVWNVTATDATVDDKLKRLKISNMMRDQEKILLRVIADEQPDPHAVHVQANLEDVFFRRGRAMVKLIVYECRRHFLKTSVLLAVLLFSILSVAKIYSVYDGNSLLFKNYSGPEWKELYWEMYEDFGGKITDEKIGRLMAIYGPLEKQTADRTASTRTDNPDTYTGNVYNDRLFFDWCFVKPMKYAYMYRNHANDIVTAAKDNMDYYESVGNGYEYRKNAAIAELFKERAISHFSYTEMYQYYLHYDFSAFLVLLICLYGLMSVFVTEKETEMDTLLLTTKAGGRRTVIAKLAASAIFICIVCSWFWLIDFAAFSGIFGSLEAASSPLYAVENFANSSIAVSLGQYALLSGLVKTAGILVLGLTFLLVSCLFKNALLPFIISLFSAFGLIYMEEAYMGSGHVLFKVINPFVLVVNRELFRKTEFVNLFGYPVYSYLSALLFAAVWGTVCIVAIAMLVRKNAQSGKGGKKRVLVDL